MSKPFDYSKWDKIELSDDEDDVHPNIDKESWFRMKHRSRVEREENEAKDRKKIEADVRTADFAYCVGFLYYGGL
jgi:cell division cycle protein 37